MTNSQLLDLARDYDELRDSAKLLLRDEFRRRSLALPRVNTTPADTEQARFEKLYGNMSESQLLREAHSYQTLSGPAQECLRAEFKRRSLEPPIIDDDDAGTTQALTEPVVIRRFRDLSEAIVARAYLKSEGIACSLLDENTVRQDWLWSNFIGGIRLLVSSSDKDRAIGLLDQSEPASIQLEDGTTYTQPVCPKCGSKDVILYDGMLKPAVATLLITGLPVPRFPSSGAEDIWKCSKCGCIWTDDGEPEPSS